MLLIVHSGQYSLGLQVQKDLVWKLVTDEIILEADTSFIESLDARLDQCEKVMNDIINCAENTQCAKGMIEESQRIKKEESQ